MNRDELAKELHAVYFLGQTPSPIAIQHWLKIADRAIELLCQPVSPAGRVPVQISASACLWGGAPWIIYSVIANDGSTWSYPSPTGKAESWLRLPDLPQPGQEPA